MAYIGLRKPIIGKRNAYQSYEAPYAFGKAIGITVTPNYAEGSLYADDMQSEYDKEFISAETTLNTNTIPLVARDSVFGHKTNEEEIEFNADDESNYVGVGWISVEKVDGKRSYTGNFLPKVKYTEPTEEYQTKGENIEYKTPSITGKALAEEEDRKWKYIQTFETEKEALNYIYKKFGASMGTLNVVSAAGTASGKTKLTVSPAKEKDNKYLYKVDQKDIPLPSYDEICKGGYTEWDGTAEVSAASGNKIVVVEVTAEGKARKAGSADVTAKE